MNDETMNDDIRVLPPYEPSIQESETTQEFWDRIRFGQGTVSTHHDKRYCFVIVKLSSQSH